MRLEEDVEGGREGGKRRIKSGVDKGRRSITGMVMAQCSRVVQSCSAVLGTVHSSTVQKTALHSTSLHFTVLHSFALCNLHCTIHLCTAVYTRLHWVQCCDGCSRAGLSCASLMWSNHREAAHIIWHGHSVGIYHCWHTPLWAYTTVGIAFKLIVGAIFSCRTHAFLCLVCLSYH